MAEYRIALAGNPNSGKTTLLNALTGTRHTVGNWPGVTVERKEGRMKAGAQELIVVDLPGVYSLSPYAADEKVARNFLVEERPDAVVNILDACNLERNLYLTMQLLELRIPTVIALNMMDEAEAKGYRVSAAVLQEALGVPVVPIAAIAGQGVEELMAQAVEAVREKKLPPAKLINYGTDIESMLQRLEKEIADHGVPLKTPGRWTALKALEKDVDLEILAGEEGARLLKMESSYHDELSAIRYRFVHQVAEKAVQHPFKSAYAFSDRVDAVVLNRWLGVPLFLLLMAAVFKLTFDVGSVLADGLDAFFAETVSSALSSALQAAGVAQWLEKLLVEGVVGGVGGVLVFTPIIALLFLAISLLEDSGYMARVAFLLDEGMQKLGLSGKAFIPMILGFGCNVPGIMAARTLDSEKDRLITILINPFMSCGARLPVYVLVASAFFPGNEALVTYSLYLLGILIAILMAILFRRVLARGEQTHFIMELPPYRMPKVRFLGLHVWERVKGYLVKAGTVIFGASVALWFLLNFNLSGPAAITESFGAELGRLAAPLFAPLGFGTWQAALSLFSGIIAKEIIVANMAIIYGLGTEPTAEAFRMALAGALTPVSAYALLVFVLLYTPCVGVIGVVRRETGSWKWTAFSVVFQFGVAWAAAFIAYRIGTILFG